jgi:phosphoglycerol transferase
LILAVLGFGGVYYSYFTAYLLAIASLARGLQRRSWLEGSVGFLLAGVLVLCAAANQLPSLLYARAHGRNPAATPRNMSENESFGLRMAQMLMPVSGHRIAFLAYVKEKFNSKLPLVTENDMAALGLAGSVGFLALLLRLLQPPTLRQHLWLPLSRLTLFALLLATLGGFGLLIAAGFPKLRAYNRMSLIIGFLALFALALLLEAARQRWAQGRWGKRVYAVALGALVILGVLDQAPAGLVRPQTAESFRADAQFVQAVERALPPGAALYQLPFVPFPEGASYDHLRPYLHSQRLRWSYPVMRGRPADSWHKELSILPLSELTPRLAYAGFAGIWLDRRQLPADKARAMERELEGLLRTTPLVCANERWVFFDLTTYRQALQAKHTPQEWAERERQTLEPLLLLWGRGFTQTADLRPEGGRWCAASGELQFVNLSDQVRSATLTMQCSTAHAQPAGLSLRSPLVSVEALVSKAPSTVTLSLRVPPGAHVVAVRCQARSVPGQERRVLHVSDFTLRTD